MTLKTVFIVDANCRLKILKNISPPILRLDYQENNSQNMEYYYRLMEVELETESCKNSINIKKVVLGLDYGNLNTFEL